MSWIERIKTPLTITTGDGKSWNPLWVPAVRQVEYNVAEFDFPNLSGTLVKRGTARGTRYEMQIFFDGENHLETVADFLESAADSRPWVLSHPLYDRLIVQPLGLNIDDSDFNVSKITGQIVETITQDKPLILVDAKDKIASDKVTLDEIAIKSFNVVPNASDKNDLATTNQNMYDLGSKKINDQTLSEEYFNAFTTANAAITQATQYPLDAMRKIQAVINAPALFNSSVRSRVDLLVSQFDLLSNSITGLTTYNKKKMYEVNSGNIISSIAYASSIPIVGDYANRARVYDIVNLLTSTYNTFKSNLDTLQSVNGGDVDSYIPDYDTLISLNLYVNFTISNLFSIALSAKQERSFYLLSDTNIVNLTHKLYGLDSADTNIDRFINENDIGLNEMLELKKGRNIVYYI